MITAHIYNQAAHSVELFAELRERLGAPKGFDNSERMECGLLLLKETARRDVRPAIATHGRYFHHLDAIKAAQLDYEKANPAELGPVNTYRSPSTIRAKRINPIKMTSSFSNREKMRRKPLSRRNKRSISLRGLYIA